MTSPARRSDRGDDRRTILIAPSSARAGMGGVGGGTGLVAVAHTIGYGTTVGQILLYLAPFTSFVVGSVLYYLEIQVTRYLERRAVASARKTLVRQLESPHTTEEHKAKIRNLLERLEESVATAELERVKLIGASPPSFDSSSQEP
jgi:hypothetical protein